MHLSYSAVSTLCDGNYNSHCRNTNVSRYTLTKWIMMRLFCSLVCFEVRYINVI